MNIEISTLRENNISNSLFENSIKEFPLEVFASGACCCCSSSCC